jgi:hypothetical protein
MLTSDGRKGGRAMSDEEVIATWMEEKPQTRSSMSPRGWWVGAPSMSSWTELHPTWMNLEALYKVEAKLTRMQQVVYSSHFDIDRFTCLHADAPTKIKALATVLRAEVEK